MLTEELEAEMAKQAEAMGVQGRFAGRAAARLAALGAVRARLFGGAAPAS